MYTFLLSVWAKMLKMTRTKECSVHTNTKRFDSDRRKIIHAKDISTISGDQHR